MNSDNLDKKIVAVVGLGYVGLPLALAFSNHFRVIGFDIDIEKINSLQLQYQKDILFTADPEQLSSADFLIMCVPTPVTKSKDPDLSFVRSAAELVGYHMKQDVVVILESTVYPGVTEEIVMPILEQVSARKCGKDFKIAYSPERINPGDDEHEIAKITKVVAGMDEETTDLVARLYGNITPTIFRAKNIKTAEAAKVIENIQRDLNIALMNELALIFEKMGLKTRDVLDAAETKWNFHRYSPGLVGGHCIPVDPYYLVFKAQEIDYHPQVILSGRAINDYMPKHVAYLAIKALNDAGKVIKGSRVLLMGLTYKENVPDIRETPVKEIIHELKDFNVEVIGFDPLLPSNDYIDEFGVELIDNLESLKMQSFDCVIISVAHSVFRTLSLDDLKLIQNSDPILIDIRGMFNSGEAASNGIAYFSL